MPHQTDVILEQLDTQIRKLEANLAKLKNAREVLLSLDMPASSPVQTRPKKLVEAVQQALEELGGGTSGQVVTWLRRNWDPDVKAASARSTLSGATGRLFLRNGKMWRLKKGVRGEDPALL